MGGTDTSVPHAGHAVITCSGEVWGYNLYIRNFLKLYKTIAKNRITIGYPILHSIIYNNIVTSSNNIL